LLGKEAPLQRTSTAQVREIEGCATFQNMKRCESSPYIDGASLELYALCEPVKLVVRLVYAILLRTVLNGYGLLSMFLSSYEERAGREFADAIRKQNVDEHVFEQVVAKFKLGVATPEARVSQWQAARKDWKEKGKYTFAEVGSRHIS
jgi:hypothetical protein